MWWKYEKKEMELPVFNLNYNKSERSASIDVKGTNEDAELPSGDVLFLLKESIIKAVDVKKELKEDIKKTSRNKVFALVLLIITHVLIFGIFIKWFRENYKTRKAEAGEAKNIHDNFKLDIEFNMDQDMYDEYISMKNSYERLLKTKVIWDITSEQEIDNVKERSAAGKTITRIPVKFSLGTLDYINTKYEAFLLINSKGNETYIYPGFFITINKSKNEITFFDYSDVKLEHNEQRFVEQDKIPGDAKIVDRTWQFANKDGSRDKRYNNNTEIPVVLYYELILKSPKGMYESFEFSNADVAQSFCIALDRYQHSLIKLNWDREFRNAGNI